MPLPRLIHPVPVVIEQADPAGRVYDRDAREPIHGARGTAIVNIDAQIQWGTKGAPEYEGTGVRERSDGYILVRLYDLNAKGVTLKRGDRIISTGAGLGLITGLDLFLLRMQPAGHWPDQGGSTLLRWFFEDRGAARGDAPGGT